MKILNLFIVLAIVMLVSACASPTAAPAPASTSAAAQSAIQISDAWIRPASAGMSPSSSSGMGGMSSMSSSSSSGMGSMGSSSSSGMSMDMSGPTSAAYMVIRNNGSIADKLVKVETDAAKTVETHTVIKEGDVMKMRPVPGIDVPANGQVKLEPGGFHVMMMDLTRKLNVGDKVKLTLFFERAGQVQLDVTVRAP